MWQRGLLGGQRGFSLPPHVVPLKVPRMVLPRGGRLPAHKPVHWGCAGFPAVQCSMCPACWCRPGRQQGCKRWHRLWRQAGCGRQSGFRRKGPAARPLAAGLLSALRHPWPIWAWPLTLTLSPHDLWDQTSPVRVRAPLLAQGSAAAQGARRRMRAWAPGLGLGQTRPYKSRRSTSASAAISSRVRMRRSASRSSRSPGLHRPLYVLSEFAPAIGCHNKHVCPSVYIVSRKCSLKCARHTCTYSHKAFRLWSMCNGMSWP